MFIQGPSVATRAALLLICSVLLMTLDHRQHHLEEIRSGIAVVLSPLQYTVDLPVRLGHWMGESLASRTSLLAENRQLREKELKQSVRLQKLAALESENQRLRILLQSSHREWERVQIAELLSVDLDPFKRTVLINRGSADGVYEGHPVLDAYGVLGQIVHVYPHTSELMLITDPSHGIPVQDNRNGLRAIALGTGEADSLEIPHIPQNADIRVGDLLVTSGLGRRFPAGYPVATISSVKTVPGEHYAEISARPTAHLERFREVLLVWPESEEHKR